MFLILQELKRWLSRGEAGKLFQSYLEKVKNHHLMFQELEPKQPLKTFLRRLENPENEFPNKIFKNEASIRSSSHESVLNFSSMCEIECVLRQTLKTRKAIIGQSVYISDREVVCLPPRRCRFCIFHIAFCLSIKDSGGPLAETCPQTGRRWW